ncbi:MAG: ligand-binding sensor domain-containing protein, partial [Bacteroides sp.]
MLKVCFFVVSIFSTSTVAASFSDYYFKSLSIEDGLSSSRVQSLCFDHKGYVWIGTEWGLNCYDKDHITSFLADSKVANSLPSNDILFIAEDREYHLWIGTSKGLVLYNREKMCFERIQYEGRQLDVYSYLLTADGILFGGVSQIYKFTYNTAEFSVLPLLATDLDYHAFTQMVSYDDETLFINTRWYGVFTYNIKTGVIRKLDYVLDGKTTILYIDSLQQVWVSYYGKGVVCYKNGQLVRHLTTETSDLTYDVVLDMIEKDGYLWLATDGGGINIVSIHDFTFLPSLYHTDDQASFPGNGVYRLYLDKQNNIWAGTIRNGLVGIRSVLAKSYSNMPFNNIYGLSNRTVNCFFQDRADVLWIGTDGGGLNSFYPSKKEFKHYKSLIGEKISSITRYSKNELLLYLFNKGFVIFNIDSGTIRPFVVVDPSVNRRLCTDGYSIYAHYLSTGEILISADHIYLYSSTSNKFQVIASKGIDYQRNSPQIRELDENNICFIDTDAIYSYNTKTKEFKLDCSVSDLITDMCIDTDNNYWIGTTNGLIFYNKTTRIPQKIETDLFQGVKSILADKSGNIWVGSSSNNLFAYVPKTDQFILIDESHGVRPNEYLFGAALASQDSTVYLGGTTGMTHISTDLTFYNKKSSVIRLVDVFMNNQPLRPSATTNREPIKVPWNFSSLQLKVLVDEDDLFRKQIFKYTLSQAGSVKETTSFSHTFTLNNLAHGSYQIGVSYITPNGAWSEHFHLLSIEVLLPWWKSWWFISLCGIFFISVLVFWLINLERKSEIRKAEEVESLKNEVYEEKIRFLTNISHELRTPLTLIYSPLKRIVNNDIDVRTIGEQLKLIYKQSLQMKEMLDMVLDIKKLEDGKEVLSIKQVSFNQWVSEIISQFKSELDHKHIKLACFFDQHIGQVALDPNKCFFVLQNLLMNSLKFSEPNTKIEVHTLRLNEKWIRLEVKDEGIGLEHVDVERLFSRFYQGNHTKGGSGVGLSYSKSLIELHGGKIGGYNNPDFGATFYIELPLNLDIMEPQAVQLAKPVKTKEVDYAYLKSYSLLVIEDID